jgi:hypothetical protein
MAQRQVCESLVLQVRSSMVALALLPYITQEIKTLLLKLTEKQ